MTIRNLVRRLIINNALRKTALLLIILSICFNTNAQIIGSIIDSVTQIKISYANIWIDGEEIGTSSDINGDFYLEGNHLNKTLIVSAIGFNTRKVIIDTANLNILLTPITYPIPDAIIKVPKGDNEITICTYKKSKITNYTAPNSPQIYAKYINCQDSSDIFYLKSIRFETLSKIKSKVNMRFLEVGTDGKPGDDLLAKNMIIDIKKGRRTITVKNLIESLIKVNKAGLFVAIEFLTIPENKYGFKVKDEKTNESQILHVFMPLLGSNKCSPGSQDLVYRQGDWHSDLGKIEKQSLPASFAMEIKIQN
jgi:hypothetical protein